jgi:6-phosphogluconolactonase
MTTGTSLSERSLSTNLLLLRLDDVEGSLPPLEFPVPRTNELRWCHVASLVMSLGLLSSCGSADLGWNPVSKAQSAPAYAYVATPDSLTTYSINPSTGSLAAVGASPLTFPGPQGIESLGVVQIATDPSRRFLYVLDQTNGIYAYSFNQSTGELTAITGSPFATPFGATSLAFNASGTYVYVVGETGPVAPVNAVVSAYSVDSSGALALIANYTLSGELSSVATAGNHLYVAGFYANSITAYSIGFSGELSQDVPGSPFATDVRPLSITVDPSGSVLYTANAGAPTATEAQPGRISAFTIDSSTGALTPVPGNRQPIAAQAQISIDPMGKFLFVPETDSMSVYAISTVTGVLSEVAGSPFPAGTNPGSASVDPTNQTVYVVNSGSANVSEFAMDSTGALTPLVGSPVGVGTNSCCMAIAEQ